MVTLVGGGRVTIANPVVAVAVAPPSGRHVTVVPVRGAPGPSGDSNPASDGSIASLVLDPATQSHGAVVTVIATETEFPIDPVLLFENALS